MVGSAIAATGLAILFGAKLLSVPAYTAIRVFDGDTFETKEKQYIRLSAIDAPEMSRCGSEEAKAALAKLIVGKKLYIKILYHQGARENGLVYSEDGLVNAQMLAAGWAILNDRDNVDLPEIKEATVKARSQKIGIFSELCTQTVNVDHPSCNIKGNVREKNLKTYHVPGCQSYATTEVQLYQGDQWFCSEKDAQKAGFAKATQCP
jgi:micrococcal nuclease